MKNMGKLLLFIFLVTISSRSLAQTFGVKGGLNLSTFMIKDDSGSLDDDLEIKPGFHFAISADFPINDMLSFQPEILLSSKGYKQSGEEAISGETVKYKNSLNPYYIDIPLLLKASYDMNGTKLYGALGPYIGVGITGTHKTEITTMGKTESDDTNIKWGNEPEKGDDLKQMDGGISFGAGVMVSAFQFGLAYELGLVNVSPYTENGFKSNNRVFRVSVGYVFGGGSE